MTTASNTRLKPQLLQGRRLLLTAFVIPTEEYYEPVDGWLDPVEVALYTWHLGCNLASASGERRYTDSYGRDEVLWSSNSILQNVMLRPEWGYTPPHSLDLSRLETLVDRFIAGCLGMYRPNHPVVTVGCALIPAHGVQLIDPANGLPIGPLSSQARVVAQTQLPTEKSKAVAKYLLDTVRKGILTPGEG